ncbi:hypothetical protein FGRMN_4803 [Fusarium graminum]|nr:hypothetical protein FGRMN_4803 [Fusarium graminum]
MAILLDTVLDTALDKPQYAVLSAISLLVILFANYLVFVQEEKYPVINPKKPFEWTNTRVVKEFAENSKSLLAHARSVYGDRPFRAYTDMGKVLVIPPSWVDALRSDKKLNFRVPVQDDSHEYISGFGPFGFHPNMPTVVTKYITKALEWHAIKPQAEIIHIVSRVSSRIFMGKELCRDKDWTKASSDYTMLAFALTGYVREWPRWIRPYVHWFLPPCWELRKKLNQARQCLKPHIERRNVIKQKALEEGKPCPFDDSIEWFEKEYDSKYDPASEQISISIVAYHTTSDLVCETLLNISQYPEVLEALREEIITVLSEEGSLSKAALYNLKLMDSVVKESQRLRPILLGAFRRMALADVTLPNGDILKKGDRVIGETTHMWSSEYYDNALEFDAYRYVKMRQTGDDKKAHLVSTTADHLGFGHGVHACPGRFFAANEIKILLCHLLLKYDWKLPEGAELKPIHSAWRLMGDPSASLLLRRRTEELDIDSFST